MCPKMALAEGIPINSTFPECCFSSPSLIFTCRLQARVPFQVSPPSLPHCKNAISTLNIILSEVPHYIFFFFSLLPVICLYKLELRKDVILSFYWLVCPVFVVLTSFRLGTRVRFSLLLSLHPGDASPRTQAAATGRGREFESPPYAQAGRPCEVLLNSLTAAPHL